MDVDLRGVVDGLGEPRLLVVGDLMLDRFTRGVADRVSPEAPVLVLRPDGEGAQPGGAARVAAAVRALGAAVRLAGAVGDDADGRALVGLLEQAGVDCQAVVIAADRPTTTKERLTAAAGGGDPVPLLRIDRESRAPLPGPAAGRLAGRLRQPLAECDAVLVADHGKGVCQPELLAELLAAAAARDVPALVDPAHGADPDRYRGAAALLPNRTEAAAILGREPADVAAGRAAASRLLARTGVAAVLLKLDRDGLVLATREQRLIHYPSRARVVRDVTGAGDVVLAAAGLCRAGGTGWEAAAAVATVAAAVAVERPCIRLPSRAEMRLRLVRDGGAAGKVVGLDELDVLMGRYRAAGLRVALTNGCFDLLHAGHAAHLADAAALADVLVVAVNGDAGVRRLKGAGRPVVPERDRAALVAALGCVDHVLLFDDHTPHPVLRRLRPDVLVKGGDYSPDQVVGRELVEGYGGRVAVTRRHGSLSTTRLIDEVLHRSPLGGAD
ncbi:MAG: PfkB family carbohydrate kinase [Gemmataceae bacterium]